MLVNQTKSDCLTSRADSRETPSTNQESIGEGGNVWKLASVNKKEIVTILSERRPIRRIRVENDKQEEKILPNE